MHSQSFFLQLVAILITARVFAEISIRLGVPSVIGELLAGVVLGPSLLGFVEPRETIRLLAEIGIILLLFEVGLGTDAERLARAGLKSLAVAVSGFALPFGLGFLVAHAWFDLPLLVALFVGGTLTATSIGITLRILAGLSRAQEPEGQIILGATVLDDVFGVVLLALLYQFSADGGVSLANAGRVFAFIALFFVIAPVAAKLISLIIRHFDSTTRLPGLIPTMMVSLVLLFAWLAHEVGAPELLGGFAAGLALSRRFFLPFGVSLRNDPMFAMHIETQMRPIVQLFTPIFFVVVGLSLDLSAVDWSSPAIWLFSLALLAVATVGKFAGALLVPEAWPARWIIGTAMIPRGEVGLVFAELGRQAGIFDNGIYAGMILVIAATTLFPPLILKAIYARFAPDIATAGSHPGGPPDNEREVSR